MTGHIAALIERWREVVNRGRPTVFPADRIEYDTLVLHLRQLEAARDADCATRTSERETIAKLQRQVLKLQESAAMACETPMDNCECAGCSYAADIRAGRFEGGGK